MWGLFLYLQSEHMIKTQCHAASCNNNDTAGRSRLAGLYTVL